MNKKQETVLSPQPELHGFESLVLSPQSLATDYGLWTIPVLSYGLWTTDYGLILDYGLLPKGAI